MAVSPQTPVLADDGSSHLLLEVGRTIRDNAHTLFGMSLLVLAAALPGIVLASVLSWAAGWVPLVMMAAPVWAVTVAVADRLLDGNAVGLRDVPGLFRRFTLPGLAIGVVPAVFGGILLGTLALVERYPDARWLQAVALLDAGVAIAVFLLVAPCFVLAIRDGRRGLDLWQGSAAMVLMRPMSVLGTLTLGAMVALLALMFGPALLLALAPLAVLLAAVCRPDPA